MNKTVCVEPSCRLYGEQQTLPPSSPCKSCGGPTFNYDSFSDEPTNEFGNDSLQEEFFLLGPSAGRTKPKRGRSRGYTSIATVTTPTVKHSDEFSCPPDLTGCPVAATPTVTIPYDMYQDWIHMAKSLSTEWLAYLKGSEPSPGQYLITEFYIPPQHATGSFCEAEDGHIQPGTIGAVHSHVGMNVFFSDTDVKHMNHAIELVVNNKGDITANGRTKLDCGRYHRMTAKVYTQGGPDKSALVEELKSKVAPMTARGGAQVWEGPKQAYPGFPSGKTGNGYFRGI